MFTRTDLRARFDTAYRIDPELPQRQLTDFRTRVAGDRRKALLENFREHMYQEMIGLDLERLMATMVPDPQLHFYGLGTAEHDLGCEEVSRHYEKSFAARRTGISFDIEYLTVDDDGICFDGVAVFGRDFARESFGVDIAVPPDAVIVKRMGVLVPCTNGKIAYEAQYIDGPVGSGDIRHLGKG